MGKENPRIIKKAEKIIDKAVSNDFENVQVRLTLYEDMGVEDNPHAIAEELNTIVPWVSPQCDFTYKVDAEGFIYVEDND